MSGDSTTRHKSIFDLSRSGRAVAHDASCEGHSNGLAKGLPRSKYGYLGSSRNLSFQGGVGNVALCVCNIMCERERGVNGVGPLGMLSEPRLDR